MYKNKWILHVDFISYDPNKYSNPSTLNLHIEFDSEKEMNQAFVDYHANIGEHYTLHDAYTIIGVEPSLTPTLVDTDDDGSPPEELPDDDCPDDTVVSDDQFPID